MRPESELPAAKDEVLLPPLISDAPSIAGVPSSEYVSVPPQLVPNATRESGSMRRLLAILLSFCLGLFLADALACVLDTSLMLLFDVHVFAGFAGFLGLFTFLSGIVIYALMGLTPAIPKRLFLPVMLFHPLTGLVAIPFAIYYYAHLKQFAWVISLGQLLLGLAILKIVQGGPTPRWPLVPEARLKGKGFSWANTSVFALTNVFVLLPAVVLYLGLCAAAAVGHFSDGFLALRPTGLMVQTRKYVRDDGKTVRLFPMTHIADPAFYRALSGAITTNSIVLMEGVTDSRNLLTNKISYQRMAKSAGLAEQQKEFDPSRAKVIRADVDIDEFGTNTIGLLNLAMLIHAKGLNTPTLLTLMQFAPPPHFEEQLSDDLLRKRNRHLLTELKARLGESESFIVPWGAAHMPGIAREVQELGFRPAGSEEYVAIGFQGVGRQRSSGGTNPAHGL